MAGGGSAGHWLEDTLRVACRTLAGTVPRDAALRSGADFDAEAGRFTLSFLGRPVTVAYPSGEVGAAGGPGGAELPLVHRILLLHYLVQASGLPPRNRWVALHELPGGSFHYGGFQARALRPLARFFGPRPELLGPAARTLGGWPLGLGHAGAVVPALPRLAVGVVVWRGGEEFPPSCNILYDAAAATYLTTEDLEYLGIAVAEGLLEAGPRLLEAGAGGGPAAAQEQEEGTGGPAAGGGRRRAPPRRAGARARKGGAGVDPRVG
ncbi:MAG: DUF3786 domain-containing protein [Acetobacteraceae bacterium]|nr:DUF3786 domain-containing protein [Acetobacteraceae bacterium]